MKVTWKRCITGLVAAAALCVGAGGLAGQTPAQAGAAPPDQPHREVHIAYYPWYGNPATDGAWHHWTHQVYGPLLVPTGEVRQAPDDIGANFWPASGLYSSNDPATVDRQLAQIAGAGIDVVVMSWWGPGSYEDTAAPLVLDAAAAHGLEVAFLLEPGFATAGQARDWMVYVIDTFGGHPAFHRSDLHGGRPLFYTFTPLKLDFSTLEFTVPPEQWAEVLSPDGSNTIRGTAHDSAVVAHVEISNFVDLAGAAGFDAVNTYFATGSVGVAGGELTVSGDPTTWPDLSERAARQGLPFHPSVGPGYLDTRIRPFNGAATRDRLDGAYYASMVDAACRTDPSIISITSFNEWHEGTQIEPTVAHVTPEASYPGFERGPDQYLDQTRAWVAEFKAGTLCADSTAEPPSSTTPATVPTAASVVPAFTG